MATLSSVKSHLTIMGIGPMSEHHLPSALHQYKSIINVAYTSIWLISLATYSLAVLYFVMFEAKTFVEYAESAFYCSVTFLHVVSYVILVQSRRKLSALLQNSDEMVQKSETNIDGFFLDSSPLLY